MDQDQFALLIIALPLKHIELSGPLGQHGLGIVVGDHQFLEHGALLLSHGVLPLKAHDVVVAVQLAGKITVVVGDYPRTLEVMQRLVEPVVVVQRELRRIHFLCFEVGRVTVMERIRTVNGLDGILKIPVGDDHIL